MGGPNRTAPRRGDEWNHGLKRIRPEEVKPQTRFGKLIFFDENDWDTEKSFTERDAEYDNIPRVRSGLY